MYTSVNPNMGQLHDKIVFISKVKNANYLYH